MLASRQPLSHLLLRATAARASSAPSSSGLLSRAPRASSAANSMVKPIVHVDVVSDTVCPWCFVGKRRLEEAIKAYSDKLDVQVHWHPFQLNPDASPEGVNKLEYYRSKFGRQADSIIPRMTQTFAELGLQYSIGGQTGNTFNSHLLIHWAGKTAGWQLQNKLVEELFLNYFTQEKYINDREVLLAAVAKVGLNTVEAAQVLDAPGPLADEVARELQTGMRAGITGVPFFTINSKYQLSGAQPPEQFKRVFDEVARTSAVPNGKVVGEACLPDGTCQ